MSSLSFPASFKSAVAAHQANHLDQAEAGYRAWLVNHPEDPDALHLLGVLLHQRKDNAAALPLIRAAVAARSTVADYHSNLASILLAMEMPAEAESACRAALAIRSDYPQALNNLAAALLKQGKVDEAIATYRRSIFLRPDSAITLSNLGDALNQSRQFSEAIELCRRAVALEPTMAGAWNNLGVALMESGKAEGAIEALKKSTELNPNDVEALCNLGAAHAVNKDWEPAVANFKRGLTLQPTLTRGHLRLAAVLLSAGRIDEALHFFRQAVALAPDSAFALNAYASALREIGAQSQAVEFFERAVAVDPRGSVPFHNLLFAMQMDPAYDARAIFNRHRDFNRLLALPLQYKSRPHQNDRDPNRRLRLGFVSGDFNMHVAGTNILNILHCHDPQQVELFCYSNSEQTDKITDEIRAAVQHWRDIRHVENDDAAEMIRTDKIDILVDLSLHSGANRLLIFAQKPAPVQVTYLGYCSTTGLDAIDYRFSDPYIDPPGGDESIYSEKTVRLPHCFWLYPAPKDSMDVAPLPARSAGQITFASMNSFAKVTPAALDVWAKILLRNPTSRLFISAKPGRHLREVHARFAAAGVAPARVEFVQRYNSQRYYEVYNWIDICLDPFPYGGGITSCDSLWMGVPIVTLRGQTSVGRGATSVLSNLGLSHCIAETSEQYIQIAAALATDLDQLESLRKQLRPRMLSSALMDAAGFVRTMELEYRKMWKTWCESASQE